ncbi:MAG: serine hydrolase domain-containing protein [Pseudomonadota bacterium]
MQRILIAIAVLIVAVFVGWRAIGPDWRALLSNAPTDTNVLFWTTEQRDVGFRMMDALPALVKSRVIKAGDTPLVVEKGAPLSLESDLDAMMEKQRIAGLVVLQGGKVRIERYGLDFGPGRKWTSHSVAKSFTSTMVGAAIKDGFIDSIDDPVSKYVDGLKGSAYDTVSVKQLMTMTSGVAWNEDYDDPGSDVALFFDTEAAPGESAVVTYMKKLPRAHPAGKVWNYSTGETNLIGVLISEAVGKPLADYLGEKVWRPYGMANDASWLLGTDGGELSGCCMQAATMDYARFGLLVLADGVVNGEKIVPEGWFEAATQKQVDYGAPGEGYGYQWWTVDDGAFQARGIFGQGIFIDPALDLVIAVNSNWTTALGRDEGERGSRETLYDAIREAVAAEQKLSMN